MKFQRGRPLAHTVALPANALRAGGGNRRGQGTSGGGEGASGRGESCWLGGGPPAEKKVRSAGSL